MLGGWGHGQETGRGRGEASMGLPRTAAPRPAPCSLACGPQRPSLGPPPLPSSECPVWGTETKANSAPMWGLSWGGGLQGPRKHPGLDQTFPDPISATCRVLGQPLGAALAVVLLWWGSQGISILEGLSFIEGHSRAGLKITMSSPLCFQNILPQWSRAPLPPLWWLRVSSGPHCICHMSSTHPSSGVEGTALGCWQGMRSGVILPQGPGPHHMRVWQMVRSHTTGQSLTPPPLQSLTPVRDEGVGGGSPWNVVRNRSVGFEGILPCPIYTFPGPCTPTL